MPLEAKLKDSYYMNSIQLFSGREYVKGEWRPVPAGKEEQAQENDNLELRDSESAEVHVEELTEPKVEDPAVRRGEETAKRKPRKPKFVEEDE